MLDIRQSVHYGNYMAKTGWKVINAAGVYYYLKPIPLLGCILKLQRPEEIRIKKIKELCRKYRVFFIIIEPRNPLDVKFIISQGFKQSKSPFLPTKTLQIDLMRTSRQIRGSFKKDTKAVLKKYKGDVKNIESSPEVFYRAWKKAVGFKRSILPVEKLKALKKSFKKRSLLFLTNNGTAGAIFLTTDKICYYYQAFTSKAGRKDNSQYRIVFDGISWAKKMGAKVFDFEGIFDERFPNDSWKGFTHFKKSFGGYEIEYPGTFTKLVLPI